jgi:hypothetical protein
VAPLGGLQKTQTQLENARQALADAVAKEKPTKELEDKVTILTGKALEKEKDLLNLNKGLTTAGTPWPIPDDPVRSGMMSKEEFRDYRPVRPDTIFGPKITNRRMPKMLAEEIEHTWSHPKHMNELLQSYNKLLRYWRQNVTVLFPSFHLRNGMGGFFNNYIGGVGLQDHINAIRIITGKVPGGYVWKQYGGKTTDELKDLFRRSGLGIPHGGMSLEFGPAAFASRSSTDGRPGQVRRRRPSPAVHVQAAR